MNLSNVVESKWNKSIEDCSNKELYIALLEMTKELAHEKVNHPGKKKVYYVSAEFLIGKLLSNNLINLGIYDEVKNMLEAAGKNLAEIEEIELEPSLGNGGLGRLAACFLDSIATLGLNGDGIGLITTMVSSNRSLTGTSRKKLRIRGLRRTAGSTRLMSATRLTSAE